MPTITKRTGPGNYLSGGLAFWSGASVLEIVAMSFAILIAAILLTAGGFLVLLFLGIRAWVRHHRLKQRLLATMEYRADEASWQTYLASDRKTRAHLRRTFRSYCTQRNIPPPSKAELHHARQERQAQATIRSLAARH